MNRLRSLSVLILLALTAPLQSQSLTVPGLGADIQEGYMFNLVAQRPLTIHRLDLHLAVGSWDVQVWALRTTGTFVGHEFDPADWVIVGGRSGVAGAGAGLLTPLDSSLDLSLRTGETLALYVTTSNGIGQIGSTGMNFAGVAASNADLELQEGSALIHAFGPKTGGPIPGGVSRIWNGRVRYRLPARHLPLERRLREPRSDQPDLH